jgi:protein disulfide-isomerase A1
MDATENDIPPNAPFQVTGFPTIKFKPAGTRDFIDYEGDRTLEDLIAFVNKHAKHTHEAKIPPPPEEEEKVEGLGAEQEPESAGTPAETPSETPAETPEATPTPDAHDEL